MAFFQPITDTVSVNVIFAEDSETMVDYYSVGLRWLLGIDAKRLHLFEELDDAEKHMDPVVVLQERGLQTGDFFRLPAREIFARLGFPRPGIEGSPLHPEKK